ncbi:MAG TPA: carboxypeptidase regulatory-like domain-containing protein [Thermoanaerobaculia bacterium]|nr:carboxypeptidase regulatory-like domain-containing protein [Thermoanaerobaculia bacterium]
MRIFCAASLALSTALSAAAATLSGTVSLVADGQPRSDASNAVVWLEGAPRTGKGPSKAAMKQESKRFQPKVVAVEKNATVDFPNEDPVYHNVFSVSAGNRFDLGLYRSGSSRSKKFEDVGIVRVYCNIHPQMVGFVVVVDSDHVAITGPDGAFRFDDVPPGSYVLKTWHEESGETSQPIVVHGSGDAPASVALEVTGFKPEAHKNKYGKDYPPNAAASTDERY